LQRRKIPKISRQTTTTVTLGGAHDGGGASPVGLQGHAIYAVGGRLAAAAAMRRLFMLKAEVAA